MPYTTDRGFDWEFIILALFFVGLLLFSYPPLDIRLSSGTRVFRPDWLFSTLLVGFVLVRRGRVVFRTPVVFLVMFVFTAFITILVNPLQSAFDFVTLFIQLLFATLLFTTLSSLSYELNEFRRLMRVLIVLLVAIAVYTIYQAAAVNLGLPFYTLYPISGLPINELSGYSRPAAVFSEPSFLANALLTGMAILLPCVATDRPVLFQRSVQGAALLVMTVAVFVAGSFGGYLTLIAAMGVLLLFAPLRPFLVRVLSIGVGIGVLAVFAGELTRFSLLEMTSSRFETVLTVLTDGFDKPKGSITVRWGRYLAGIEAWKAHPFLGVGVGQYEEWIVRQTFDQDLLQFMNTKSQFGLSSLHGGYIQVLAQTGLTGFILFSSLFVSVLKEQFQVFWNTDGVDQTLVLSALCVVIVQLISWTYSFSAINTVRWGTIGLMYGFVADRRTLSKDGGPRITQ